MEKIFRSLIMVLLSLRIIQANIINVPADQPTIQYGINVAMNGDTVLVQPNTYVENINFDGKNIVVASLILTTGDTSYISQTVIDGNHNGNVVRFENDEGYGAILNGFTITNGSDNVGGGILCRPNTSPSLVNLIVVGNTSTSNGAIAGQVSNLRLENVTVTGNNGSGIFIESSSYPWMTDVKVTGNTGHGIIFYSTSPPIVENVIVKGNGGHGIWIVNNSSPNLRNVVVSENSGYGIKCHIQSSPSLKNVIINGNQDGGIYCRWYSSPSLNNVVISGNSASDAGGGIYCLYYSKPKLKNVTITGNIATRGGGIYCEDSSPILMNTILWDNSPQEIYFSINSTYISNSIYIAYSNVQGGEGEIVTNNNGTVYWLEGNIDADPLFVDPENDDLHLQDSSLCIGTGIDSIMIDSTWYYALDTDIEGNPRPNPPDSWPDMGAYENPLSGPLGIDETLLFIPKNLRLLQSYPNPFNPITTISYQIPELSSINLSIFNINGQLVSTLVNKQVQPGNYSVKWDAKDFSSGVYFYKIVAGKYTETGKAILLK